MKNMWLVFKGRSFMRGFNHSLPAFVLDRGLLPISLFRVKQGIASFGTFGSTVATEDWNRLCEASSSFCLYRSLSTFPPAEIYLWRTRYVIQSLYETHIHKYFKIKKKLTLKCNVIRKWLKYKNIIKLYTEACPDYRTGLLTPLFI